MDIKLIVIERAIKWLIGGELLGFIKQLVLGINDLDMSGEEKRLYVIEETKKFFTSAGTIFISIGIEIAVLLLRSKLENQDDS